MAFKMKGMEFGKGTGSAHKKIPMHGTSIKDLSNLSYDERRDYKALKHRERQLGRSGREHDHSYQAYLDAKGKNQGKNKVKRRGQGWDKIKDFFKGIGDKFRNPSLNYPEQLPSSKWQKISNRNKFGTTNDGDDILTMS